MANYHWRIPKTKLTHRIQFEFNNSHWTGHPGGGCVHGDRSQSWPWWKVISALWCDIGSPKAFEVCSGRRLWIYTLFGACYFDLWVDRRGI